MLDVLKLSISGVTGAVSKTATASKTITGKILEIYLDVSTSADVDVDITAAAGTMNPAVTLFTADDITADTRYQPRILVDKDVSGSASTDQVYPPIVFQQTISLVGSDGSATVGGDSVTAYIIYEKG